MVVRNSFLEPTIVDSAASRDQSIALVLAILPRRYARRLQRLAFIKRKTLLEIGTKQSLQLGGADHLDQLVTGHAVNQRRTQFGDGRLVGASQLLGCVGALHGCLTTTSRSSRSRTGAFTALLLHVRNCIRLIRRNDVVIGVQVAPCHSARSPPRTSAVVCFRNGTRVNQQMSPPLSLSRCQSPRAFHRRCELPPW